MVSSTAMPPRGPGQSRDGRHGADDRVGVGESSVGELYGVAQHLGHGRAAVQRDAVAAQFGVYDGDHFRIQWGEHLTVEFDQAHL